MGDFTAVEVNGTIQKNGGNVASYFCTPSGRVIHAVIGPVSGDELLREAKWALARWEEVKDLTPLTSQQRELSLAHQSELPAGVHNQQNAGPRGLNNSPLAAMWGNMSRLMGTQPQKVHQLLAEKPLAPLEDVYVEVFERILGERVSKGARNVELAEQGLQHAEHNSKPMLFVLHHGHENSLFAQQWLDYVKLQRKSNPHLLALIERCVVIVLPLKELPALSHRLKQEPYSVPSNGSPLFVITDPRGKRLDSLAGWESTTRLSLPLARAFVAELKLAPPQSLQKLRETAAFVKRVDPSLASEIQPLIDEFLAKQKKSKVASNGP